VFTLKTIQEKDLNVMQKVLTKEQQVEKGIVVKVGSIMLILCLTSCSKDISLDPTTTISNQFIKAIIKGNNGN
tara:strand:- start:825 stop:1043 length:219 start_codon:yes stop_codon:yes gene_type:complete